MALLFCGKCNHTQEVDKKYINKKVKCPKCEYIITVHDTVFLFNNLVQKYHELNNKLKNSKIKIDKLENLNFDIIENNSIEDIDINNTKILMHEDRYLPIIEWFNNQNIEVTINKESVDTTGFFDEVALLIGDNYNILHDIMNQIKYIQNKNYDTVKVKLSNKNNKEITELLNIFKEMYDYSFISRYSHHKKDKTLYLGIQNIPKIKSFFNGIWMEWYILMKILKLFKELKIESSSMRNLEIKFKDNSLNEIDIFFLTRNNIPIYIECKSGEFRKDIDKYLRLKKNLNIEKENFILCIFGLDEKHAQGLTSMYDISFFNEASLIDYIKSIVVPITKNKS